MVYSWLLQCDNGATPALPGAISAPTQEKGSKGKQRSEKGVQKAGGRG